MSLLYRKFLWWLLRNHVSTFGVSTEITNEMFLHGHSVLEYTKDKMAEDLIRKLLKEGRLEFTQIHSDERDSEILSLKVRIL